MDSREKRPYRRAKFVPRLEYLEDRTLLSATFVESFSSSPGFLPSANPYALGTINGVGYFSALDHNGAELWRTDGTCTGTHIVKEINPVGDAIGPYESAAVVGNTLFFTADDGVHGQELWKSDGTAVGTVMVSDINPEPRKGDGHVFY
jgi:ELWxxDGT repeat protein